MSAALQAVVEQVAAEARLRATDGELHSATNLTGVEPDRFALAVSLLDGTEHVTGDADVAFPMQSVAKAFALVLGLQRVGEDLWERVGREPSGDPFNSLVQLEREHGLPRNPLINAGSLVVCDVLLQTCDDPREEMLSLLREVTGADVGLDEDVLEAEGGDRNRAMAHLMAGFGNLRSPVDEVMALYEHQCAISLSTRYLARAIRFLAHDGVDPASGRRVLSDALARRANAVMLTCGTYDSAGEFAYEVGFPCKSGVTGAIVGDVPGRLGVCAWSPPLGPSGNSVAGREALRLLSDRLDLSVF